jgi:hypothetical protein
MEHTPESPDSHERVGPDRENLQPGEIDLTGATQQEDDLRDVIGDAILEAETSGGEIPTWGARTIARALANRLGSSDTALHHYALSGLADPDKISRELAEVYSDPNSSPEARSWVNWLSTYMVNRPPDTDADRRGTVDAVEEATSPQVEQGLAEHGDAFRAYLGLPDVDESAVDLLETFHEFYIGAYPHIDALLDDLTEVRDWESAIDELAARYGIDGLVSLDRSKVEPIARETWDIVEVGRRLYVFTK